MLDDQTVVFERASKKALLEHIQEYIADCGTQGQAKRRITSKVKHLNDAVTFMNATRLVDLQPDPFRDWLQSLEVAPTTVNEYRCTVVSFLNWCKKDGRVRSNLLEHVSKVATIGKKVRKRRALTEDEISRLLQVAKEQDLLNAGQKWSSRHAVYLVALFTGLRRNELRSIVWSDVDLKSRSLRIREDVGKSKRNDSIPLHESAVQVLEQLKPANVSMGDLVFASIPTIETLKRDYKRAGILLKDDAERTVDFHTLRATFATRLIKQGVQPSYLKELMRHADIKTTNEHYTDLRLHDLDGAVNQLSVPEIVPNKQVQEYLATGTDDCTRNCTQTLHETVQNSASACEVHGRNNAPDKKINPAMVRGYASKCDALLKAGERIRTADIHVGNVTLCR
jgi:integrase/recombinase XerC